MSNNSYGYVCLYGNKRVEIHATSAYEATLLALAHFEVPVEQKHMLSVVLVEKNGKPLVKLGD